MNKESYYEYDDDGERPNPIAIAKETLLGIIIDRHDLSISYPEILAFTNTYVHPSVDLAVADLKASNLITEDLFVSPTTNNAFHYYQLNWQIPDTVEPLVSSHPAIRRTLIEYNDRINKSGIASLNAQEWCLRSIYEHAQESIRSGQMTVPLSAIGWKMIHDLKDEGVEKWLVAYQNAAAQAIELFQTRPDGN